MAKVNTKVGSVGLCLGKIKEYIEADPKDPALQAKKDHAQKSVDHLIALFGNAIGESAIVGCDGSQWID